MKSDLDALVGKRVAVYCHIVKGILLLRFIRIIGTLEYMPEELLYRVIANNSDIYFEAKEVKRIDANTINIYVSIL